MTEQTYTSEQLSALGERAAASGMRALETELASLLATGLAAHVPTVLLTVLADDTAPEVVRLRALGRLLVRLDRCPSRSHGSSLSQDYVLLSPAA